MSNENIFIFSYPDGPGVVASFAWEREENQLIGAMVLYVGGRTYTVEVFSAMLDKESKVENFYAYSGIAEAGEVWARDYADEDYEETELPEITERQAVLSEEMMDLLYGGVREEEELEECDEWVVEFNTTKKMLINPSKIDLCSRAMDDESHVLVYKKLENEESEKHLSQFLFTLGVHNLFGDILSVKKK